MTNHPRCALKAFRLARGLTQRELAARTGLTQPEVSHFETGTHAPKGLRSALAIADALGVSVTDIWPPLPIPLPTPRGRRGAIAGHERPRQTAKNQGKSKR